MFNRPLGRALLWLGVVTTAALLAFGAAPAAAAQQPAALRTTVELDKPHYLLHEDMRLKFTITNIGGQAAERVRFPFPPGVPHYDRWDWGPLRDGGDGVRIEPGETRVFEFEGGVVDRYDESDRTAGIRSAWFDHTGRQDNEEDRFGALATVTPTEGDVRGVVYADRNHNGSRDAGESLAGTTVQMFGGRGISLRRTTDSEGRFLFEKVPGGRWLLGYTAPDGWVVPRGDGSAHDVLVTPAGVDLTARAERPAAESLGASLALDRNTYEPGQGATMTVTLSNTGSRPVEGVQARCLDYGRANYLGADVDWGALSPHGAGVTVAPGESKTFRATDVVPQEAVTSGEVVAVCRFGPEVLHGTGYVEATARAAVPGGFGTVAGRLWHDRNRNYVGDEDEGVADVRVVLHDQRTDVVVGEAVSDPTGHLRFDRVPAGAHRAHVDGPWRSASPIERDVTVAAGREAWLGISLEPAGPQPQAPAPAPDAAAPAAPGVAPEPHRMLAETGVSVSGPAMLGVVLLVLGAGVLTMSRNREAGARRRA